MVFNWFNRQHSDPKNEAKPAQENQPALSLEPSPSPKSEKSTEGSTSEEKGEDKAAEAYLNYAKAAFENIRRRQQQAAEAATSTAEIVLDTPPISQPVATKSAIVTETVVPASVDSLVIPPAVTPTSDPDLAKPASAEPVEAVTKQPEILEVIPPEVVSPGEMAAVVAQPAMIEPSPSNGSSPIELISAEQSVVLVKDETPSPAADGSQPFWMRAKAEQEAKLERLQAITIAVPEETPPTRIPPATSPQPVESTESTPTSVAESTEESLAELSFDEGFRWSAEVLAAQGRRAEDISIEEITWLQKLRQGLDKTRRSLVNQLKAIVGQGPLNRDAVESIEDLLLQADVGIEATDRIITALQNKLREEVLPPDQAIAYLKKILRNMLNLPQTENLEGSQSPIAALAPEKGTLNIWLITGVNGAGKTTTIGKLAHISKKSGYKCLIAAADTFRAAAVQQVKVWGERSDVEVIANPGQNTDPAAVVFDAITAARSRETELLLVDTAGRLQNKKNLMDELSKIRRIIDKKAEGAKVRSFLVLDATLGQNGVRQAEVFQQAAQLDGVILTKLDGTAKGGIALAIVQQLGLPICFIGAGEGIEDLRPFSSYEFVEALLSS